MLSDPPYDLVIAGAGSVGLFSAHLASREGIRTLVVEKESEPVRDSRSIGIHPPSLEILSRMGMLDAFLERGVIIRRGIAMRQNGIELGKLDFHSLDSPCPFIVTIPQSNTVHLLEKWWLNEHPESLIRGEIVSSFRETHDPERPLEITLTGRDNTTQTIYSRCLLACDGKKSAIRTGAGIPYSGSAYRHRYAMGDFPDNTEFGMDAVIFLSSDGLVESFPLPGRLRRWVIQQPLDYPVTSVADLARIIGERCGIAPDSGRCEMFSEFGVARFMAERFWHDRIVLAGDAAHVVSPIGGQGMNLGWMNAVDAIAAVRKVLDGTEEPDVAFARYDRIARKRAMKGMRRAEFNMKLGNRSRFPNLRNRIVSWLLSSFMSERIRDRFTMQGL